MKRQTQQRKAWRLQMVVICMGILLGALFLRLVYLGVWRRHFLLDQSNARTLRQVSVMAHRGMITDRAGEPLAVSTPVDSLWVNPKMLQLTNVQLTQLAALLQLPVADIKNRIDNAGKREFVYLKRGMSPNKAAAIKALKIPGVFFQREFRRFYPEGEVDAQLLGFTNVDDKGQEGLELAYNHWLQGLSGRKEVMKDRLGHTISEVAVLRHPKDGNDLALSLDQRIQYQAYIALKQAVTQNNAASGSVVVLDVKSGEVLAMANVPSFNPNMRKGHDASYRNRAMTDVYEPGSTIKPFNLSLALASGKYTPQSIIDTRPGWMNIDGHIIQDTEQNGVINLTQLLQKSSNVGAAKVMLSLDPQDYWNLLNVVGFGHSTGTGFPGESAGSLPYHRTWRRTAIATLAFGYGLAVTPLQLAQAYAVLACDGIKRDISLLKVNQPPQDKRVLDAKVVRQVVKMMETVVQAGGTGVKAQVAGYRIAGKTGTAYLMGPKGYDKHRFVASFVGFAPVSDPRLVVAVVIKDLRTNYYGGSVAAPVFAKVMGSALRFMNIQPDGLSVNQ